KRTEEHVIHGTDYESQTEHILKVLDMPPLSYYYRNEQVPFYVPFHLELPDKVEDVVVTLGSLKANILGQGLVPVVKSPHYSFLTGNKVVYEQYFKNHFGTKLTEDHSPEAFQELASTFRDDYQTKDGKPSLIIAEANDDG